MRSVAGTVNVHFHSVIFFLVPSSSSSKEEFPESQLPIGGRRAGPAARAVLGVNSLPRIPRLELKEKHSAKVPRPKPWGN